MTARKNLSFSVLRPSRTRDDIPLHATCILAPDRLQKNASMRAFIMSCQMLDFVCDKFSYVQHLGWPDWSASVPQSPQEITQLHAVLSPGALRVLFDTPVLVRSDRKDRRRMLRLGSSFFCTADSDRTLHNTDIIIHFHHEAVSPNARG